MHPGTEPMSYPNEAIEVTQPHPWYATLLKSLLVLFCGMASSAVAQVASPELIAFKQTVTANGEAVTLHLHVFKPEGWTADDQRPAVVFFFGGAWLTGSPTAFYPQSTELASQGMVAICAEYRVKRREGTPPQYCVRDAKSAMRYVRSHAGELGIDPEMIATGGGSAGGHLAAATALVKGFDEPGEDLAVSCVPKLLLLFNPVIDTSPPDGWGFQRLGDDAVAMSPADGIHADQPPTIIFHGTSDKAVPIEAVRRFKALSLEAGAACDLFEYPGQGHGFFHPKDRDNLAAPGNELYLDINRKLLAFLAEQEFIELPSVDDM